MIIRNRILTALVVSIFSGAAAGRAAEGDNKLTPQQAQGFARQLVAPVQQAVIPGVNETVETTNASSWALWDLIQDLSAKRKTGAKPVPDLGLVETSIRLRMRLTTGMLCSGATCKAYPGDGDFARAAKYSQKKIQTFVSKLKPDENLLTKTRRDDITYFIERGRKRMIKNLHVTFNLKQPPQATPMTPGEDKYRQLSLEKKQGSKLVYPPWP